MNRRILNRINGAGLLIVVVAVKTLNNSCKNKTDLNKECVQTKLT